MNRNLKLFWIPCGDQDFLLPKNEIAHATMTKLGINHEFVITEGDNHSWPVWRRYLASRDGNFDTSISLQLILKGFGSRDSAAERILKRGILGYD